MYMINLIFVSFPSGVGGGDVCDGGVGEPPAVAYSGVCTVALVVVQKREIWMMCHFWRRSSAAATVTNPGGHRRVAADPFSLLSLFLLRCWLCLIFLLSSPPFLFRFRVGDRRPSLSLTYTMSWAPPIHSPATLPPLHPPRRRRPSQDDTDHSVFASSATRLVFW